MSWSIIIPMANREKRLATALEQAGHQVFLPLKRAWRGKYAKHSEITRLVAPGYVFAILEPHQIHAFHGDGAIRILRAYKHEQQEIDRIIAGWTADMEAGLFDDPKPTFKAKPIRSRNRSTRRAKHRAMTWAEGLCAVLSQMAETETLAA